MIRVVACAVILAIAPGWAMAHKLIVFASVDCEVVTVEAKFSNGRIAQAGDVRVMDGENRILDTLQIGTDGTAEIPLNTVDHSGGLLIEVDTGSHGNYWIVTPDDIARNCGS